jgi:uncharacterized membrane protein
MSVPFANQATPPPHAAEDILFEALRPEFSMVWNFFLALVPLVLAFWLFRFSRRQGALWWFGVLLFVLFLPNAAYVLTDVLHLILKIRETPPLPVWSIALVVLPEYILFIGFGFQCYVLSLLLLRGYLQRQGWGSGIILLEILIHAASAVGVYLGRFLRLNSWDALTEPEKVVIHVFEAFEARGHVLILGVLFAVVSALYYVTLAVDLALIDRGWRLSQ